MWRSWSKSPVRIHNSSSTAAAAAPSSSKVNFSCSSFKDIHNLCTDEEDSESRASSTKLAPLRRVCVATSLLRNWSVRPAQSSSLSQSKPQPDANSTKTPSDESLTATTSSSEPQQIEDSRGTFETSEDDNLAATTSESKNANSIEASEKKTLTLSEPEPEPEPEQEPEQESEPEPEHTVSGGDCVGGTPERTVTPTSPPLISLRGADKRIVIYFTSLRVVRSTFEDCKTVRSILQGFPVSIDERDLSMDSCFLEELQAILGEIKLTLPRVFIGGRYIGGAEEIRQLNETGELKKIVEGLPAVAPGVCDTCGGYCFILCDDCNGSHKVYSEKNGFRSCTACNENGLIRCPSCSCGPLLAV